LMTRHLPTPWRRRPKRPSHFAQHTNRHSMPSSPLPEIPSRITHEFSMQAESFAETKLEYKSSPLKKDGIGRRPTFRGNEFVRSSRFRSRWFFGARATPVLFFEFWRLRCKLDVATLALPVGPRQPMTIKTGRIFAGVGGWTYEPWRGVFYPKGLPHARELSYAAEHLTSIEINGTFYRTQTPATFRKWASEVPDGFVFSLKGPRYAVNRRVLGEAGDSIKRFLDSGITELGGHLGPLLWQFAPTKKFDDADFGKFLELLPKTFDGHRLRHVVEVRHDSFKTPAFIALARKAGVAICYAEHKTYTEIADVTADFIYARLQK